MKIKIVLVSLLLSIVGCSHISSNDVRRQIASVSLPQYEKVKGWSSLSLSELQAARSQATTQADQWWMDYREASLQEKLNPTRSCELYSKLAEQKNFPLWDLAWLRSQNICQSMDPQFMSHPAIRNSWYKLLSIDVRKKYVLTTPNLQDDYDLKMEEAKFESQTFKKEKLLLELVRLAEKMSSPTLVTQSKALLIASFPRYQVNPPVSMWLAVAKDYRQVRQFTQAANLYRQFMKQKAVSVEEIYEAWKGLRATYKVAQMKADLVAVDQQFTAWVEQQSTKNPTSSMWLKRWHDQLLQQARQLWTEDQSTEASTLLQKSLAVFKNRYSLDETYFVIARMKDEARQFEAADADLSKALQYPESSIGLREKILWTSAWLNYKLKKYDLALKRLDEILSLNIEPSQKYRYQFWKARTLASLNSGSAQAVYSDLANQDPLGFYGLQAFRDRQLPLPPLEVESHDDLDLSLSLITEIPSAVGIKLDWLILVKEAKILEAGLDGTLDGVSQASLSELSWLRFLTGYARANLYVRLFTYLPKIKPTTRDHLLKTHPDLLFPRPYDAFVIPAANKNNISPFLVYSIMRQESAYNPEARSGADAMGLLQLLPSLAEQLAAQNGIPYTEAADLFKPEINIPLGAIEMKNLLAKYKQNTILTACGYNAADRAVRGWIKNRFRTDVIEFIEEIPYEETRTYVKLVLRNHIFYQRLAAPQSSLVYPEDLMSWPPAPLK